MQFYSTLMTKRVRPPKDFARPKSISHVRSVTQPQFAKTYGRQTGSRKRGLVYENQVVTKIERDLPKGWVGVPGPWFLYLDKVARERYAQPDWLGICVELGRICIVEVKLTRNPRAWWQLNELYKPLVRQVFPHWEISLVEVASKPKHFPLPESVGLISQLTDAPADQTSFMVIPYEGRRTA